MTNPSYYAAGLERSSFAMISQVSPRRRRPRILPMKW